MTPDELAHAYLDALGHGDVTAMLSLFTADGQVHSPLYGPQPAGHLLSDFTPNSR